MSAEKLMSPARLEREGMVVKPAAAAPAEGARVLAFPHPMDGVPDLWLLQIEVDGRVESELPFRPVEVSALRRVLAMVGAYVADLEDEEETNR
jgi:hypothetical protein